MSLLAHSRDSFRGKDWGSIVAVVLLASAVMGRAQDENLAGVVTGMSEQAGALTLILETSSAAKEIELRNDTTFEIDEDERAEENYDADEEAAFKERPATLIGRFVEIQADSAGAVAARIRVESQFRNAGLVMRANPEDETVVVDLSFGGPVSLKAAGATQVTIDGEPVLKVDGTAALNKLVGLLAWVEYHPKTGAASTIAASTFVRRLRGTFVSVDLNTSTLVISDGVRQVTLLAYDDDFVLTRIDFRAASLLDLERGQPVIIEYVNDPEGPRVALTVHALTKATEVASGIAARVGDESQTVAIAPVRQSAKVPTNKRALDAVLQPRMLKISSGTKIMVDGRSSTLAKILPGSRLRTKYSVRDGVAYARTITARTPRR